MDHLDLNGKIMHASDNWERYSSETHYDPELAGYWKGKFEAYTEWQRRSQAGHKDNKTR